MESVLRGLRPSAAPCGGAQEAVATATTQGEAAGFFTLGQVGGRWVLLTPDRKPFFSLGLNHIDAATLRTVENGRIWREKYGNSMHRWLDESVRVKLKEWGFNTCGWSQESVAGGRSLVIHSRPWTYDEYQSLDTFCCPSRRSTSGSPRRSIRTFTARSSGRRATTSPASTARRCATTPT